MSYVYWHAKATRVVDGDTVRLAIDMGNRIAWEATFRLNGINCPEPGSPGGPEARLFLFNALAPGISKVETFKPDKYGRWLVDIYVGDVKVNAALITAGHAVPYFGGAR